MSVHLMETSLFGNSLTTPEMCAIFEEKSVLKRWMEVESALASAQADLNLIPENAASYIAKHTDPDLLNIDNINNQGKLTGHSLMGFLNDFRRLVGKESAKYLHVGATTQDIIDTAQMLGVKEGLQLFEKQIIAVMQSLLKLAIKNSNTIMAGRTHGGQALPITLGFKMSVWLDELSRQLERLREMKKRNIVGNMTGAVGTFACWGDLGFDIQKRVMEKLGLGSPDSCWHSSRDRITEVIFFLSFICSTAARIGTEVYNLSKTEVGEVEEPFLEGRVGSTTMPHKKNPIHSEWIIVMSRILRSNAAVGLESMILENERDASAWKAEWIIIPESFVMASSIFNHLQTIFDGLVVHPDRMMKNMDLLKGLLLSEPAMFVLAEVMPLPEAHERVHKASMEAFKKDTHLLDELFLDPEVDKMCDKEKIKQAMDAGNYLGLSLETVKRITEKVQLQLDNQTRGYDLRQL